KWHIGGLTSNQARDSLKKLLEGYVVNPSVLVILKSFRVTFLGAAGSKIIESDNERMSIIEAIAHVGGIPITGQMKKIMIIRDKGDGKEYGYVDITTKEIFTSPYFYLHSDDIIYV